MKRQGFLFLAGLLLTSSALFGVWSQPPTQLSSSPGTVTQAPDTRFYKVVEDSHGNAAAIWILDNGTNRILQGAYRPAGGVWQTPSQLSPPGFNVSTSGGPVISYDLVIGGNGEAVAAWLLDTGTDIIIQASYRTPSSSWGSPVTLSLTTNFSATAVGLVMNDTGEAYALLQGQVLTESLVFAQHKAAGSGSWDPGAGAPVQLSPTGNSSLFVSNVSFGIPAALDDQGNVVVMWTVFGITPNIIQVAYRAGSANPWVLPGPTDAISDPTLSSGNPRLAMRTTAKPEAIWETQLLSSQVILQGISGGPLGTWSPIHTFSTSLNDVSITTPYKVVQDAVGNTAVAWEETAGANTELWAAYKLSSSALWGSSTMLAASLSSFPSLQFSLDIGSGQAILAWTLDNGGISNIQAATISPSISWQTFTLSPNPATDNALVPWVDVNDSGEGYVAWMWQNSPTTRVIQAAYKPVSSASFQPAVSLSALTDNSQIITTAYPWLVPIALDEDGNVVVVWADNIGTFIIQAATGHGGVWTAPVTLSDPLDATNLYFSTTMESGQPEAYWLVVGASNILKVADGNNLFGPAPPSALSGQQIKNRYLKQTDLINRLTWTKSPTSTVTSYRVYPDGSLIGEVFATTAVTYIYQDHNRREGIVYNYQVSAVNASGESSRFPIGGINVP